MRKSILIMFVSVFWGMLSAQETQLKTLHFEEKDFVFQKDEFNQDVIYANAFDNAFYENDTLKPALPYFVVKVLIGATEDLDEFDVDYGDFVQKNNVRLINNPKLISFNQVLEASKSAEYEKRIYPLESKRCFLQYTGLMDGYRILQFAFTPFLYDASTQILTLYTSVTLRWKTRERNSLVAASQLGGQNMLEMVLDNVVNVENAECLLSSSVQEVSSESQSSVSSEWGPGYLIICPQYLKTALEPLKAWQQQKGFKTEIETLESIYQKYQGKTSQIKIKRCIKDYYVKNKTKYVLLAGNGTCLPVVYCLDEVPSDWFYACLDDSDEYAFDWDANSDGTIGRIDVDKVDLYPEVVVARAPVETVTDVQSFIAKVQAYELNPPLNDGYRDILFAGVSLRHSEEEPTDAELNSRYFFDNDIKPYFPARVQYFFGRKYNNSITKEKLQNKFQQGFHIIHMLTHGGKTVFGLSDSISPSKDTIKGLYTTQDAKQMVCQRPSIFMSLSCLTNAFDHTECLGRAFMNNAQNGVAAYIGTTQDAFYYAVNHSVPYGGIFEDYRTLFRTLFNSPYQGMLGDAFCGAKIATITNGGMWNFYALNMCGDPAMMMYTDVPRKFAVQVLYSNGHFTVEAGVDSCIFAVRYKRGGIIHKREYIEYARRVSISKEDMNDCEITLRHKNYITKTESFNVKYIQNKTYAGNVTINGDIILVGRNVTSEQPTGDVIISSGKTIISATRGVFLEEGFEVKNGAEFEIKMQ